MWTLLHVSTFFLLLIQFVYCSNDLFGIQRKNTHLQSRVRCRRQVLERTVHVPHERSSKTVMPQYGQESLALAAHLESSQPTISDCREKRYTSPSPPHFSFFLNTFADRSRPRNLSNGTITCLIILLRCILPQHYG